VAASPFEQRNERLLVPAGTVKLRVNFASGGSSAVVGTVLVDDLSVRISKPVFTGITSDLSGKTISWFSVPGKTYTVQFAAALGTGWTSLITGLASGGLATSYLDATAHAGRTGLYQVIQE